MLKDLMQQYVDYKNLQHLEGMVRTKVEGVVFFRRTTSYPRQPMLHESGIIVLGQGHKNIFADGSVIRYGDGKCLIVGMPLPLDCEAIAEPGAPLMGISIHIPLVLLQKLVNKFKEHQQAVERLSKVRALCVQSAEIDRKMEDACRRLMEALCNDLEAELIGSALLEEIVYRALLSKGGSVLFELADQEGRYARIATVLEKIHQNYSDSINVSELASSANMSVSAFHNAFRNVTLETPIQYIKKVRLNRARELISYEGKRVNDAARAVGYASTSQFSREFKRHFNESPKAASVATA